ncbi:MAG: hypothetical protein NT116_04125 [Candidatus Parcubacteria bacterium]|nr:hypothetical protein [Candidatus Parcubacteria bacterium]
MEKPDPRQVSDFSPQELAIYAVDVMARGTRKDKEQLVQACLAAGREFTGDLPKQGKGRKKK